jgi:thiamine kinase-like enzyme
MEIMKPQIEKKQHVFHSDCLNHTDVACDNFVRTPKGFRMIDWEKPRVDDRSYDISCFLSEPVQKWCSPRVLTNEESEHFLLTYARLSGIEAEILQEKVILREPLVSLHWILWAATKICDFRSRITVPELVAGHKDRIIRFQKVADPVNVEKILDSF